MFRQAMQNDPNFKGVSGKEANWTRAIGRITALENEVILLRQELNTLRLSKPTTQAIAKDIK